MACTTMVTAYNKANEYCVLLIKRGPTQYKSGKWCFPGGFLDYGETLVECAQRELKEETGLVVPCGKFSLEYVHDIPEDRQNVVMIYHTYLQEKVEDIKLSDANSEQGEVTEYRWCPINQLEQVDWAFNLYSKFIPIAYKIFEYAELPF